MSCHISKTTLQRCRVLVINTESIEPPIELLRVLEPRRNYAVITTYRSRNMIDTRRITLAYKKKYRIPDVLIFNSDSLDLPSKKEIAAKIDSLFVSRDEVSSGITIENAAD